MKGFNSPRSRSASYLLSWCLGPPARAKTPLEWTSPAAALWGTLTSSLKVSPSQLACPTSQTSTPGRPWRWSTCWGNTGSSVTWCWWWVPRRFMLTVSSCRPAAPTSGTQGRLFCPTRPFGVVLVVIPGLFFFHVLFRAMFTGELAESRQTEVVIRDIDERAMELLIDFAYTSQVTTQEFCKFQFVTNKKESMPKLKDLAKKRCVLHWVNLKYYPLSLITF